MTPQKARTFTSLSFCDERFDDAVVAGPVILSMRKHKARQKILIFYRALCCRTCLLAPGSLCVPVGCNPCGTRVFLGTDRNRLDKMWLGFQPGNEQIGKIIFIACAGVIKGKIYSTIPIFRRWVGRIKNNVWAVKTVLFQQVFNLFHDV